MPRPTIDRRLDGALTHRLTSLVAAAGHGKSTLVEAWVREVDGVLVPLTRDDRNPTRLAGHVLSAMRLRVPDLPASLPGTEGSVRGPGRQQDEAARAASLAASLGELLANRVTNDLVVAFDDLDVLTDAPAVVRFVETFVRSVPRRCHVVTVSQAPLPFPVGRLRQDRQVLEFDATDLALAPDETTAWCTARLGPEGSRIAPSLHAATGGWPAGVHAAIDELGQRDPATWRQRVAGLTGTTTGFAEAVLGALADLPLHTRRLLQVAVVLPVVTDRLAAVLDVEPGTLASLASMGLFLEGDGDRYRVTPLGRQALRDQAPLEDPAVRDVVRVATGWYLEHDMPVEALRVATDVEHDLVPAILADHGERLLDRPEEVLAAVVCLPDAVRAEQWVRRLEGFAHHDCGDWEQARERFSGIAEDDEFDAAVASRLGFIHHLRGELDEALDWYRRGHALGKPPGDAAYCLAMSATVHWLRGDHDGARTVADGALDSASASGDARALAATHTVLAMLAAAGGDRRANDAHYLRALEHAERAHDVVQQARIRCNRASHHHEEGRYGEALVELEVAGALADLGGFAPFAALALSNRAETFMRLGRLDEAIDDAAAAAHEWEQLGSRLVGYGLVQLAHLQALRGDVAAAATTYRQAITRAEEASEVQSLVPALAGLARLLVDDDPDEARSLVDRAVAQGGGLGTVTARIAAARVALATGQRLAARELVESTATVARGRRDRAGTAELLELRAELDQDLETADAAVTAWERIGDPIGAARARLVRARLLDDASAVEEASAVRASMEAIGCRSLDTRVDELLRRSRTAANAPITIQVLGTFRVRRGAMAVDRRDWQSRKARDLLRMLVAARGRPVPREQLILVLWPDADPFDRSAAKRLNVMVSTLRSVLDPDRAWPSDHIVASDDAGVRLDLSHVDVDVERLLAEADAAAARQREGRRVEALTHWRAVEAACTGDVFQDDPYADWAVSLRERVRQAYVEAAAAVATAEDAAGAPHRAVTYWLRLLERDPYDEGAHLGLVRSLAAVGRHGDARRRYGMYADRMRELELEPAPFPA